MTGAALLVLTLLSQAPAYYSPQEAQAVFAEGTQAWARQDVAGARAAWERLVSRGHSSQEVLYNAGTAALAAGDVGAAVLYLERALRAGGETEDIEANLAVARSRQLDQVVGAGLERGFAQRLASATDARLCGWFALVGTWGACLLFALARLRAGRTRSVALALGALGLLLALPACALVATHAWVDRTVREGVVMAATVPVRELPQVGARVAFELHAGLKLRLLDDKEGFVRVKLPNGLEGWAAREGIEPL
ncbi:MAG: SH3 domain-containing protein [Deltaproteobacteria bacterium]|nr:SH3 domain-containing protein [Deltaproteobacteria bacterium]